MGLTTFGAIMGFAAEMLQRTGEIYEAAVPRAKNDAPREALQVLRTENEKNQSLIGKTRRENVTEMILEPVSGLRQEDYEMAQKKDSNITKLKNLESIKA